jgi:hypothetical protein
MPAQRSDFPAFFVCFQVTGMTILQLRPTTKCVLDQTIINLDSHRRHQISLVIPLKTNRVTLVQNYDDQHFVAYKCLILQKFN